MKDIIDSDSVLFHWQRLINLDVNKNYLIRKKENSRKILSANYRELLRKIKLKITQNNQNTIYIYDKKIVRRKSFTILYKVNEKRNSKTEKKYLFRFHLNFIFTKLFVNYL